MGEWNLWFEFAFAVLVIFIVPGTAAGAILYFIFRLYPKYRLQADIDKEVNRAAVELEKNDALKLAVEGFRHEFPQRHEDRTEIVDGPFAGDLDESGGGRGRHHRHIDGEGVDPS